MFKYFFSFNLDIRIHTSPKVDGHGSKAFGPGVCGLGTKEETGKGWRPCPVGGKKKTTTELRSVGH